MTTIIPVNYFRNFSIWLKFPRLYLSLVYYGRLITNRPKKWLWGFLFIPLFTLSSLGLFKSLSTESEHLQISHRHALVYDYEFEDNVLYYSYWDNNGSHKINTQIVIEQHDSDHVKIIDNQIFMNGKQLTKNSARKLKPTLIANNNILYLTDEGNGPGFYTLKTISLKNENVE